MFRRGIIGSLTVGLVGLILAVLAVGALGGCGSSDETSADEDTGMPVENDAFTDDVAMSPDMRDDGTSDAGSSDVASETSGDTGSGCARTHEKVGWMAELEEKAHNVGGTAEIIDNCTVEIRNFTYDGGGIVVEIYGAANPGEFAGGFAMSSDLVRSEPYEGETLTFTLPEGKTLDDLGAISVWCVDADVDFGSGEFAP
jgi:hypothetical protein